MIIIKVSWIGFSAVLTCKITGNDSTYLHDSITQMRDRQHTASNNTRQEEIFVPDEIKKGRNFHYALDTGTGIPKRKTQRNAPLSGACPCRRSSLCWKCQFRIENAASKTPLLFATANIRQLFEYSKGKLLHSFGYHCFRENEPFVHYSTY